jgi:hypothetical protein
MLIEGLDTPEHRNLRQAFSVWIRGVVLAKDPGFPVEKLNDLRETRAMLAERNDQWREEWKQEGLQEGRQRGLQEGLQEGRHEGEGEPSAAAASKAFRRTPSIDSGAPETGADGAARAMGRADPGCRKPRSIIR